MINKKMLRKIVGVILGVSMLGTTLAGCSGKNDAPSVSNEQTQSKENTGSDSKVKSEEKFTLTYATTGLQVTGDGSPRDINAQNSINYYEEKFKELYPNATLELVSIPGNQYEELFRAKYSSQTLEDVVHLNVTNPKQYMKAGLLMDLSDQPWVQDVLPAAEETCMYDGKWYAAPQAVTAYGVFYNKDIFEKYNLEVPNTWAELMDVCETLKENGITPFLGGFKDTWLLQSAFEKGCVCPYLQTKYKDPTEAIYNGEITWDGPEMKVALDKFTELIRKGYYNADCLSIGWEQSIEVFKAGDAAMYINGSFFPGAVDTEEKQMNLGFFAMPNDDGTQKFVAAANAQWGVNAQSEHVEAAIDRVNIMSSKEAIEIVNNNANLSAFSDTNVEQANPVMNEIAELLNTSETVNNMAYATGSASNKLYQELLTKIIAGKDLEESDMADVQMLQEQDKSLVIAPE